MELTLGEINEVKARLTQELAEITNDLGSGKILVMGNDGVGIELKYDYAIEKFVYSAGQFVKKQCQCGHCTEMAIVVGVGKGCPENPDSEELWFHWEEEPGISHFCGASMEDLRDKLVLVE